MPSIRNKPPKTSVKVTILRGTHANGAKVKAGEVIQVTRADASLLCYAGHAVRGEQAPAKKVARSKPAVTAER